MNEAARSLIIDIDEIMLEEGQEWSACTTTEPHSAGALDLVEFRVDTPCRLDVQVQSKLTATFRSYMPTPFMLKVSFWTPSAQEPYAVASTARMTS